MVENFNGGVSEKVPSKNKIGNILPENSWPYEVPCAEMKNFMKFLETSLIDTVGHETSRNSMKYFASLIFLLLTRTARSHSSKLSLPWIKIKYIKII